MTIKSTLLKVLGVDAEIEQMKEKLTANSRTNITMLVPQDILEDPRYNTEKYPYPLAIRTYQLFSGRWEYEILENDIVVIHQDFEPGTQGWVPMDKDTAEQHAKEALQARIDSYAAIQEGG